MKKKLLPLLAMIVIAAGFTSCKKDFVCECTYTDDIDGQTYTDKSTINGRRPEASLSCQAMEISYSFYAGGGKCKLK